MEFPPDTMHDDALIESFLDEYATGKHAQAYDQKRQAAQVWCMTHTRTPEELRPDTFDWIDELDACDPSET